MTAARFYSADFYDPGEAEKLPTDVRQRQSGYKIQRGDLKADTTWVMQPWGQFIVAAASLALFGADTVPAGCLLLGGRRTAALLYSVVRKRLASPIAALASVALVLTNSFWVMHMRQCRYYALSSLSLACYPGGLSSLAGRQAMGRTDFYRDRLVVVPNGLWFRVACPWDSWIALWISGVRRIGETVWVFIGFCAVTVPFCFFYELAGRTRHSTFQWPNKIGMLFPTESVSASFGNCPGSYFPVVVQKRGAFKYPTPPWQVCPSESLARSQYGWPS